jgi:signal transduction histidine kinase
VRRRILIAILSIATLAIVMFGVPLAVVVERFVDEAATLRVERQTVLATRDVPRDFATSNDPAELPSTDGISMALYDRSGRLVSGKGPATADNATRGALANQVTDTETDTTRIVAVPLSADEQIIGAIRAEQSTAASDARTQRIVLLLAALAVGVVLIGAAIGYVVAGRLARPVRRLRDAAVQLGNGDFTIAVPRSNVPELDQAALAMTATAERLDDLVTRERSFSADASHQLRTPLAGLRAAIETELQLPRPDRADVLRESLEDIDRLERTIDELLHIARTGRVDGGTISLSKLLDEVEATWHGPLALVGRPLIIADARDVPTVKGNGVMLRHAVDVLLDNALNHGRGAVRVDHSVTSETVTITVADEGPGFTDPVPQDREEVETMDDRQSSHGLGIPLARRLVEALPGRLTYRRTGPHPQVDIVLQRAKAPDTDQ